MSVIAVVHFVNYKKGTQSRGAMGGVMFYVMQEKKTLWEGEQLISGINCQPQTAYDEFLNTKALYHKGNGVMFYHMVQSFPKGETVDPVIAHEAARRLSEYFEGCEVLICTHVDREHIHSHCIINSVNFETGKKLHLAKEQVQELKQRNDAICQELGLPVFQPSVHRHARGMGGAEYHTALKGQSWKLRLANTVDECIITQELWDTVHQMMKARRRENGTGEIQPFAGLVKCADCGSSLNVSYDKRKGRYTGFSCWVYKNYGKERCTSHAIGWVTLNRLVLEDIRRNALEARRHVQDYMDMLMAVKEERQKADVERCRRELKKVDKRLDELIKILNKLYEDVALEKISEERYQAMAPKYEREQIELRSRREELTAEIAKNDEVYNNIQQFIPLIWKYTNIQELTPYILNELIEKIVVHEKEVGPDGIKTQQVDIYYKFIGLISRKAEGGCEGEVIKAAPTQREVQTAKEKCSREDSE